MLTLGIPRRAFTQWALAYPSKPGEEVLDQVLQMSSRKAAKKQREAWSLVGVESIIITRTVTPWQREVIQEGNKP